jgi:hypothetical protein
VDRLTVVRGAHHRHEVVVEATADRAQRDGGLDRLHGRAGEYQAVGISGPRHQMPVNVAHGDVPEVDGFLQPRAKDTDEDGPRRHPVEA